MYIKQVIIQGFKSYRDKTVIEPFDPGHNVVVGRNGSGKSNFFHAIQFVLSNEFYPLRLDQRQAILNEGNGPRVISAFVEIIFDNRDGRLPIDTDEVYLRREIGAKKDNYFVNKKNISRTDVTQLLESAGFAVLHPFYIVKQGEINKMATAHDYQRLKLLREVAGTRTYDERRKESESILRETEGKLGKIVEFLQTMDERLDTLEQEKDELKEYHRWDKQRRSLEYTIYDRDLKNNKRKLAEIRESHAASSAAQANLGLEIESTREMLREANDRFKKFKKEFESAQEEHDALSAEQQQQFEEKTKITLTINDLTDEAKIDEDNERSAREELDQLGQKISAKSKELDAVKLEYERAKLLEEESARQLAAKEHKRKELYVKEGRGLQFNSKDDRDKWIENELQQLARAIRDKEEHRSKLVEDLERVTRNPIALKEKIGVSKRDMEIQIVSIKLYKEASRKIGEEKNRCAERKKQRYRQESALQINLSALSDDLARANQKLRSMVGKQIINGRDSIRKILENFRERPDTFPNVESYCGQVIESFDCDEVYYKAVEVTAGTRLFNHIVETDELSTKILKEMNVQRLPGDLTFMPLNRLRVEAQNYPPQAKPMMSCLKYNPKYEPALTYIFGKTLICPDLPTATDLARESGWDCITLDGDQVSCKGSMTGGYFNNIRSRLEIQKTISEVTSRINIIEEQLTNLRNEIKNDDAEMSSHVTLIQQIDAKISKASDIVDMLKGQINLMNEEVDSAERYIAATRGSLASCVSSLLAMNETRESLENELQQDLVDQLSETDKEQIFILTNEIRSLHEKHKTAFADRMKCETMKNKLDNLLTNNLLRRQKELGEKLRELSIDDRRRKLDEWKIRLGKIDERLARIDIDIKEQRERLMVASKSQKIALSRVEKLKAKEKETCEKIETDAKGLDKLASRENRLEDSIVQLTRKITELGSLPNPEAYTKFIAMPTKQIFRELERTNNNLKKFSHVNKKALDQFVTFSDQKEKLARRKAELDRADEKIKDLMSALEQCKYETIEFTFKEVSKYFADVFKKLVPCGRGELVMKTSRSNVDDAESSSKNCDRFVGIGIRVSFDGQAISMREINQLSGGQKSLVALALIFAIQKTDPVPFYLFDEIDQALDAEHRNAVANMIHELSSGAQFITTTFKPELLQHANKFYGVKFAHQVSHIECITKEEAADFVTDGTNDE